ncbi:MAG: Glu-tRNA(Gln) amidotransferase subunit GatD [Candidatus Woesearchaeota archaeon]|jgi:glutamyl-tRNA(Gln) amidotransferase subunit D|nr:Glu-tRNA(Gln) amidotransferase subunit GatD [Candidatus Woesearchaeota archaeon]
MTKPKVGDMIEVKTKDKTIKGILMPRPELLDKDSIIIKLQSGYNIGIENKNIKEIKTLEKYDEKKEEKKKKVTFNKNLPIISILHTGGTIASKIDYRTGGVESKFSPEDLVELFPELKDIAQIRSKLLFQMSSENMEPEHWQILAKEVDKEIKEGTNGIIITHGTDTMHYTAAALSFMLQSLPIPILLVGAQRSSDRGSSDAAMNLIAAANFITKSDFSGVAICMHGTTQDKCCYIHQGNKARKLHTSRRDAFRSINVLPIAKVFTNGRIELSQTPYTKKDKKNKLKLQSKFEDKVAIIKMRPGFNLKELETYENYKGLVIEGTGLGHIPNRMVEEIKKLSKKSLIVMTSQCIYGTINMNIYSTGRDLIDAGVISAENMTSETAYVKLGWALANSKSKEEAKKLFQTNITGEITERIVKEAFLF